MTTRILAGGGHAHVEVPRRLAERPIEGVRLMLISPDTHKAYSGMLPGLIAGHYTWDDCHIDLRQWCRRADAEFVVTRVEGIEPAGRQVHCANGQTYAFDASSLDVGSTPDLRSVPGAAEHTVPVKPVSGLLQSWGTLVARCEARSTGRPRMAVVGGGAGGVEIALATRHRCRLADPARQPEITLVRQGLLLAENLRRHLAGEPLLTYRPQRHFLSLISTGDRHAVASYAGLSWQGRWVWTCKGRIDRRFMRKYGAAPKRRGQRQAT